MFSQKILKMDDVVDLIDFEDIDDIELLTTSRGSNKQRHRINPLRDLSDEDFRYNYRFSKSFVRYIVNLIKDELFHDSRGCPIPPEVQVACALRSWTRREIQDNTADIHGVSQPVVSQICKKVAGALAVKSKKFIKMPTNIHQYEETKRKFCGIANFPQVIGAIDCTHIRIKRTRGVDGQLYINRKGFPSINIQVVCNADLKIMDIETQWCGSVPNFTIFRECRIKQRFEAGAFPGKLLGDNCYPCTPYLLTPLLNPTTPQEILYNNCHILTRKTVEHCFGVLKQRFCCLSSGMFGDIETARTTILACAVLHNIAIDMGEELPIGDSSNDPPETFNDSLQNIVTLNTLLGNMRRKEFIQSHFS